MADVAGAGGAGFLERFRRLEVPAEKKRVDWTFLEQPLDLPAPLPLAEHAIFVLVNRRVLVPDEASTSTSTSTSGSGLILYDRTHPLREVDAPARHEAAYRERHAKKLARAAKRFRDAVPIAVLEDAALLAEAEGIVRAAGGSDAAAAAGSPIESLAGDARLLRLHEKLYDLRTLREYVRIFEKAIEPDLFRRIQGMPDTTTPEAMLAVIEASLDLIHAKARSPLRNKMATSRAVLDGVTLLPIFREPAANLFEAYARLLDREIKLDVLAARDRG